MESILGIDLGTTNSAVSIIDQDGNVRVLELEGRKTMPSVVGIDPEGQLLVGATALNQWVLAPDRTVRSVKRKMGGDDRLRLGERDYAPQEISAMILRKLKDHAAERLGAEHRRAVITVPAFFNEQQRECTREAGELAGLEVVRIINEPTAASLVYKAQGEGLERLLVYDLGGGTFDVSVVQVEAEVVEVLASHGDTQLGGDDFDQLLMDHVCERFAKDNGIDLRDSAASRSRVLRAVEAAKCRLSFEPFVMLEEEFIGEKDGVPLHLRMELSRNEYEKLIEPLINKTLVCVDEALSDSKLTAARIDRIILVGGASRTPLVHQSLSEQLDRPIHGEIDPDLCVSMGAAVQGGLIEGLETGPVLVDITPHSLGVRCRGYLYGLPTSHQFARLIDRNTSLPASRSEVFYTTYEKQEAVAIMVYQGEHDDVGLNDLVGEFRLEGLTGNSKNEILVQFDLDLDGILKVTAVEKATGKKESLRIENSLTRFRDEEHDQARLRLDEAFGLEAAPARDEAVADADDTEGMPKELVLEIDRAREMLERGERIVGDVEGQDADDLKRTMSALRSAIDARSLERIRQGASSLDDLVFYLQEI